MGVVGGLKVFKWRYGELLRYPACWETSHTQCGSYMAAEAHTGYNFWEEYLLRFFKTPPFKNLNLIFKIVIFLLYSI